LFDRRTACWLSAVSGQREFPAANDFWSAVRVLKRLDMSEAAPGEHPGRCVGLVERVRYNEEDAVVTSLIDHQAGGRGGNALALPSWGYGIADLDGPVGGFAFETTKADERVVSKNRCEPHWSGPNRRA
jgi:hypothetical protein